ncbi:ABC transporter permease, putative [Babesia ovata]|uniref:ABC transporter permease, putative n=1 Tax=Babesia ovata TaxID=189622 RepID=A0A2H6KA01_9APIC|nr:ABC transporter permease, putative [Babesia ovata]GBE59832.1 ABC transporter permease, putative [Babesia ovata]
MRQRSILRSRIDEAVVKAIKVGVPLIVLAVILFLGWFIYAMASERKWPFHNVMHFFNGTFNDTSCDNTYDGPDTYDLYKRYVPKDQ